MQFHPSTTKNNIMSRSVSTHPDASAVVFLNLDRIFDGEELSEDTWADLIDDIRNILTGVAGVDAGVMVNGHAFTGFQGYRFDRRWIGRENMVILTGEVSEITISEYMGVAAVCLAPLDPHNNHHVIACANATPYFSALLRSSFPKACLSTLGKFSNGETVYQAIE
jgi:hypothetical protein